jgi:hypothetical protein
MQTYMLQQLKKNLSTEALKGFRGETSSTPHKSRTRTSEGPIAPSPSNSSQVMVVEQDDTVIDTLCIYSVDSFIQLPCIRNIPNTGY